VKFGNSENGQTLHNFVQRIKNLLSVFHPEIQDYFDLKFI